jgi:hypothetical protein
MNYHQIIEESEYGTNNFLNKTKYLVTHNNNKIFVFGMDYNEKKNRFVKIYFNYDNDIAEDYQLLFTYSEKDGIININYEQKIPNNEFVNMIRQIYNLKIDKMIETAKTEKNFSDKNDMSLCIIS